MKIALIFPGITDVGFNSFGDGIDGSWHSHGLMSLSACLKSEDFASAIGLEPLKHEVSLIDLRRLSGWDEYQKQLLNIRPNMVCITMMSCDFNPAIEAARIAKEILPEAYTIVGGAHPSICPNEVLTRSEFDTVILKEGEISMVRLAEMAQNGKILPPQIEGECPDLDKLPFSDRTIFGPYEVPIAIPGFKPPFMTFIAGRGCIYNCSFCQPAERHIFGPRVRRRSPENFTEELLRCKRLYNFNSALIHDDCLIEDIEWIKEFAGLVRRAGCGFLFACQGRADIICKYPRIINELKSIGLRAMIVGFESGSNRMLKFIRKGVTREMNVRAAEILHEAGISIWANYMFGLPTETRDEMAETITMLREIRPDHYSPAIYTPHPGSDLFDYCIKNNLMLGKSHDSFRRNVTEVKIKGQDWHEIQWAVGESVRPKGKFVPYSKDYVSHWGDLENILTPLKTQESFGFKEGITLEPSSVENMQHEYELKSYRSTTTDPQFIFDFNPSLLPRGWRYIFVDIEVSVSSRGQFIWWTEGLKKFQATRHFRIPFGRHSFMFDLSKLKTYQDQIGNNITWSEYPVDRFRFDPAESEGVKIILHRLLLIPG